MSESCGLSRDYLIQRLKTMTISDIIGGEICLIAAARFQEHCGDADAERAFWGMDCSGIDVRFQGEKAGISITILRLGFRRPQYRWSLSLIEDDSQDNNRRYMYGIDYGSAHLTEEESAALATHLGLDVTACLATPPPAR
ncbi:hypothetical protein [Zavarzinella formosa]|uniref:hypothetical protein n=1 Tax=Zavarzinella formosa TaxID=360055 RepID=UPI000495A2D5|nr:hypothetical protein [Zavarzinella formosa]